jgi:hypothetical protein
MESEPWRLMALSAAMDRVIDRIGTPFSISRPRAFFRYGKSDKGMTSARNNQGFIRLSDIIPGRRNKITGIVVTTRPFF